MDQGLGDGFGMIQADYIYCVLYFYWSSLIAQFLKNLPAMQENWVESLGWEDPLEKGKATHSSILAWRIPWTVIVHVVAKSWTRLSDFHFTPLLLRVLEGPLGP